MNLPIGRRETLALATARRMGWINSLLLGFTLASVLTVAQASDPVVVTKDTSCHQPYGTEVARVEEIEIEIEMRKE